MGMKNRANENWRMQAQEILNSVYEYILNCWEKEIFGETKWVK